MSRGRHYAADETVLPEGTRRVLVHVCCAPCSGGMIERALEEGVRLTLAFINPNIHPREEYDRRRAEVVRFAASRGVPLVEVPYDPATWFAAVRGHEDAPEGGERCRLCMALRLRESARVAVGEGCDALATSLGVSRRKKRELVNACGREAVASFPGLRFWARDWRKQGGEELSRRVALREGFYRQTFCGCVFSHKKRR